jgi:polyphosphate kinase 2 (PPK2 family)
MVQIFNRSYYEDVLVPTVQKIYDNKKIKDRYKDVNNFEKLLQDEDTIILKFFLHISRKKQVKKLKERLELRRKFWKFDPSDLQARDNRDAYRNVYHDIFDKCNDPSWNIIPADQKRYKNYLIAKTIVEAFEEQMKLKRPDLEVKKKKYKKLLKKSQ